nr:hypothetical protein [Tanacetum cinerariifolium]
MEGYKLKDLKLKKFDSIQEMFDKAFKRVNTFEDIRTELVEGKEKRAGEAKVYADLHVGREKRLDIALGPRYKVGESSSAAARQTGGLRADYSFVATVDREIMRDPEREVGYRITDSWDEIVETLQGAPAADRRRQTVILELLRIDHRRSTEISELRIALQGQVTALQGQVIALQAHVTTLQGLARSPTQSGLPEEAGGKTSVADVGMPTEVGCVQCQTNMLEVLDRLVIKWESCRRTFLPLVSYNGVVVFGVHANVGAIKCVDRVDEVIRNITSSSRAISSHSYGYGMEISEIEGKKGYAAGTRVDAACAFAFFVALSEDDLLGAFKNAVADDYRSQTRWSSFDAVDNMKSCS